LKDEENRTDLREDAKIRKEWLAADKNGNGSLDFSEIKDLMHKLNFDI
jgi:Ca2+-binding EF-hand superfamily protein